MDTIFEKTIDMKHNNIKAVEWQVPQIQAKKDYGDFEFQSSLEHISNDYLKTFKSYRFEAYKNWGFPKWKRTKLNGYEPEKYGYKAQVDAQSDHIIHSCHKRACSQRGVDIPPLQDKGNGCAYAARNQDYEQKRRGDDNAEAVIGKPYGYDQSKECAYYKAVTQRHPHFDP